MDTQIDIVVATNRNTQYLRDALQSVIAQDYNRWRLIVVDDGSPDPVSLGELIDAMIPDALILHQENAGQAAARNHGVSHGSAPFVTFLDDDDVWRTDRLTLLLDKCLRYPSAPAAYSGGWYMDAAGREFGTGWDVTQTPSRDLLAGRVPIPILGTMIFRRETLLSVGGFDESFRLTEDDDLILKALQLGEMVAVPDQLVGYRRHGGNITNARFADRRAASERLIRLRIQHAVDEGNEEIANLLRSNLRAFILRAASETPAVVLSNLQDHRWSHAIADMSWALKRAPLATITATGEKTLRRVSKGPKRTRPERV